jgi:ubiquinol-cytochrome c reductase cytochrome c subunit
VQRKRAVSGGRFWCALLVFAFSSAILAAPSSAQKNPADSPANGARVYAAQCAKCHGDHGEGRSAIITIAGPSLRAEHDYGKVMTAVEMGPSHMPRFVYMLSVQDMRDVSHYVVDKIADIPLGGGDIGKGGELFRIYCASCHRTAVRGGALAYAGTNAPALTHKSAALIAGAIRWGPGPMPAFPRAALSDDEVASIVEYVRFAEHPPNAGGLALTWYGPVPEGWMAWVMVLGLIGVAMWIERGGKG